MPNTKKNLTLTFVVSAQNLDKVKLVAQNLAKLDRIYTDTMISCPGGVDKVEKTDYVLGDYFKNIEIVDFADSFAITMYVRDDVMNFCKDLMVDILLGIEEKGGKIERKTLSFLPSSS